MAGLSVVWLVLALLAGAAVPGCAVETAAYTAAVVASAAAAVQPVTRAIRARPLLRERVLTIENEVARTTRRVGEGKH